MKRIKTTFSERAYKASLDDIRTANQELREVTLQNIRLEPKRQQRGDSNRLAKLGILRRQAASLHRVITDIKTWRCGCGKRHFVSLRLETRPSTHLDGKAADCRTTAFPMLFSVANNPGTAGALQWQYVEIVSCLGREPTNTEPAAHHGPHRYVENLHETIRLR